MLHSSEQPTGTDTASERVSAENRLQGLLEPAPTNGEATPTVGERYEAFAGRVSVNGDGKPDDAPALALFCYDDPAGAVGGYVSRLAAALARRHVPVHVFTRRGFAAEADGVHLHVLGETGEADLVSQIEQFTQRACNAFLGAFQPSRPVTLLACEWSSAGVLGLLRGLRPVDTVLSLHSVERQRSDLGNDVSRRINEIEAGAVREAGTVLWHDPATAGALRAWMPDCAGKLREAARPFPAERFNRPLDAGAVKARYHVGPVDPTIVCVGDLSEQYGPDLLVKAMPAILKNHKQARLVVVGDGPLYWPLRVYSRYLLIEHAVRLPGSVTDDALAELIQAADVVCVPSRASTPWWPIQAAWAALRPVVATHDAAPALTEHDRDSILCYPSENSLVWGVERVLYDAEMAKAIGRRGEAKLEERFGWNAVAAQVEELMGAGKSR